MDLKKKAAELLREFKGESYIFGIDVLDQVGERAAKYGNRALVVARETPTTERVLASLKVHGVELAGDRIVPNAAPNAPREDVYRIETYILLFKPDVIISVGGGSTIDAVKASIMLATQGQGSPEIESYFGVNLVTESVSKTGCPLLPHVAVMTSSSSSAHLTKYSNVTDPVVGQKKLIVDEAIVPTDPVFDYGVTASMPIDLTIDGALDGISHCLEVYYGAGENNFSKAEEIAATAIELVVKYAGKAVKDPGDFAAREAIGLATDLGGYAIMIGGTNGAHLTSFSLVDVTSHGRACGIMNPYYTLFFAPNIERQLRTIGKIFEKYGYIGKNIDSLSKKELGTAVAEGMIAFNKSIGSPATLGELEGFSDKHVRRAISAAKNPQLKMKLQNMPIPLTAEDIDEYMGPILESAKSGDLSLIKPFSKA